MSFEAFRSISLIPGDVVAQRRFVIIEAGTGEVVQAGANAEAVGISLEAAAAANDPAIPVALLDGAKVEVEAGAAVALGADVTSDAAGKAVAATVGQRVLGFALTAAAADGEVITIVAQKGALAAP